MRRSQLLIAAALCLMCFGCQKTAIDLEAYDDPYLVFGLGGGLSGMRSEYILLEDGRTFGRTTGTDSLVFIQKYSGKQAGRALDEFERFAGLGLNAPGDLYYFVIHKAGGNERQLVWGDPGVKVVSELQEYWNRLNAFAKPDKK